MWRSYPSVRHFARLCVCVCVLRAYVCVHAIRCQRLNRLSYFRGIRSKGSFQNSVGQEFISWKSAHWLPYFTYGPQWVSTLLSTYIGLSCVKFSSNVHVNPLMSVMKIDTMRATCYLGGVNEVLPNLIIFCSNLGDIRHRMFPQTFEWLCVSWKLSHWRPYHLGEVRD